MKRFFMYMNYVIKHKYYVAQECFENGLFWRGIIHDLSKFSISEFWPYAVYFYKKNGLKETEHSKEENEMFDLAWLIHQKRNKHHWQWWILPLDDGGFKPMEMPEVYWKEMVCDWVGAGKAQGFKSPEKDPFHETRIWYAKNKDKMILHDNTRENIERFIGVIL